jgi:hypothetical protein
VGKQANEARRSKMKQDEHIQIVGPEDTARMTDSEVDVRRMVPKRDSDMSLEGQVVGVDCRLAAADAVPMDGYTAVEAERTGLD